MHPMFPLKIKPVSPHFIVCVLVGFIITISISRAQADDSAAGASTNAPSSIAPAAKSTRPAPSSDASIGVMSIDDLLNVTVTSAGQKEQKLSDVAAAMTVLNSDDIRRSGATTIPDLLRYVPGVEVGEANNTDYAVTIRGLAGSTPPTSSCSWTDVPSTTPFSAGSTGNISA